MTYHQLTQEERYLITPCKTAGHSQRQIALMLGRAASTISRELRRNATTHDSRYRAEKAHSYAVARRRRCRRGPRFDEAVHRLVEAGLRRSWSPDQIVGFHRAQGLLMPSIETIYRSLREDKRHAMRVVGDWIQFYNHRRAHQALGMKTPAEAYALAA